MSVMENVIIQDWETEYESDYQEDYESSFDWIHKRVKAKKEEEKARKKKKKKKKKKKEEEGKKKKKKKKKARKREKRAEDMMVDLEINLEEVEPLNPNLMAEFLENSKDMVVVKDELWIYHSKIGCYRAADEKDVAKLMKTALGENSLKVSSGEYKESYKQLLLSENLVHKGGFFANQPYINCENGVVDVLNGKLLKHSPDYMFKHYIHAKYDPDAKAPVFKKYLDDITGGDDELRRLMRVILGYLFSHYNNAKVAVILYGVSHCGKSVLCNLAQHIVGAENVCHVDLSMLHNKEFAAALAGKVLNIAPDLKDEPLKDIGYFKSLISNLDTISVRPLYGNPRDVACESKMLVSSNHLVSFGKSVDSVSDLVAAFNRLLYWPFQSPPVSKDKENRHLAEQLVAEKNAIFTWAVEGLKSYIKNKEQFPTAALSEEIKAKNIAQYCPEQIFFEECLKKVEQNRYESSDAIKKAYDQFCRDADVKRKGNISSYLENELKMANKKIRIDSNGYRISSGNPIHVYEGIRLKKKWRPHEEKKEACYLEEIL